MGHNKYVEWGVRPELSTHLACTWVNSTDGRGDEPFSSSVLPDGCVDIVWDGCRLFVAGPDTGPVAVSRPANGWFVGARFRPGLAPTVLGIPSSTLLDLRIDLVELLPLVTDRLAERMAIAASGQDAARMLEQAVHEWLPTSTEPDPLVIGMASALQRQPRIRPVATLADALGVSERQLHRRCTAAVGYGPKMLDRVLRFRRFLALLSGPPDADLAMLAIRAGYADQAHLTRECRRLGGTTPGAMLAAA